MKSGAPILGMWTEMLSTHLRSSVLILVWWKSPVRWNWWGGLIILKNMKRVRILRLVHIYLKRVRVWVILFYGASSLIYHRRLCYMVTVLRWGGGPGQREVGRGREPVIEVARRWPCKRRQRNSVSREIKWWWWSGESWWRCTILSIQSRRWGEAWRGALLSNVLRGNGVIKHLWRRASMANRRVRRWDSSRWYDILWRGSRRGLLLLLLWRWLASWPLVLIGWVCSWGWHILMVAANLHGRGTAHKRGAMNGWRRSLQRRGS